MISLPPHNLTGTITQDVINAIGSCYDIFTNELNDNAKRTHFARFSQANIEKELWLHLANQRLAEFGGGRSSQYTLVFENYLQNHSPWYSVLDALEFVIDTTVEYVEQAQDKSVQALLQQFEQSLNFEFERLDYGYRIVSHLITDVTSPSEKEAIEEAVNQSTSNVATHLQNALQLYSKRPDPDYRDSIKESISAVEGYCNDLTDKNTLSAALPELKKVGIEIPQRLYHTFITLYGEFASSDQTGIRHGMNKSAFDAEITSDEAYFMLVTCSTFINYLRRKQSRK